MTTCTKDTHHWDQASGSAFCFCGRWEVTQSDSDFTFKPRSYRVARVGESGELLPTGDYYDFQRLPHRTRYFLNGVEVTEQEYETAQAFHGGTLTGESLDKWREAT